MPFIINVLVNFSALKYFHIKMKHLMLEQVKMSFVFIVYTSVEIFVKCLHDLICRCGNLYSTILICLKLNVKFILNHC